MPNEAAEAAASASTSSWAVFTFFGYTAAVFVLALLSHRLLKGKSFLKEYFLGSRSLGVWALAMSYAATSASGGSFTGFPAKIWQHGWILALWIASYMVVPVVCMGMLGKRLNQVARKSGAITLPDVLRDRFQSPGLGVLISLVLAFFLAFNLVAQFKAGGVILQVLLQDSELFQSTAESVSWLRALHFLGDEEPTSAYCLALLFFAAGVIIYTTYGGFRAVVWTDVLQGVVMFFGVLILLPLALSKAGGLENATRDLAKLEAPRLAMLDVRVFGDARVERNLPAGVTITARVDESDHVFESIEALVAADFEAARTSASLLTLVMRAREDATMGREAWRVEGDVIRVDSRLATAGVEPIELRVMSRRSNVSAPGPHASDPAGFLPLGLAISFFVMWAITGAGQPGTLVRLMAFRDARVFKRSILMVTFYYSLIYVPLILIFVCARKIAPGLESPDQAMAETVRIVAPPLLAGILLAAPFAAVMSTVDSFLLMISSSLVRDIYQRSLNPEASTRRMKRLSYLTTVVVGIVVTAGALNPPRYLQDIIIFTSAGLASCFLAPMVYALFWRRATARGIYAAILGGFGALMLLYAINWVSGGGIGPYNLFGFLPAVWGLVVSFAAGFIVSITGPPPPRRLVDFYFSARVEKPEGME